MANTGFQVRCGIPASDMKLPFTITTFDVQKYILGKFKFVEDGLRKNAIANGKDPDAVPHVEPKIYNTKMGKKFVPFFVVLPDTVLNHRSYNPNVPSVFRVDTEDEGVRLDPWYYNLLRTWMYDGDDRKAFYSADWRRMAGIPSPKYARDMSRYAQPKIEKIVTKDGERSIVMLMLDPIRVFHDMLIDPNNIKQRFGVFVEEVESIDTTNYRFEVSREVTKKKKGAVDDDVLKAIRKKISATR